jgi:hypothetical protein
MIFNNYEFKKNNLIVFIGSGVANLSCALELSKKHKNILVLEAGSRDYDEKSRNAFDGEISNESYINLKDVRYRGLFGSVNRWYGWSKPIFENVFKKWDLHEANSKKYKIKASNFFNINNNFPSSISLNNYENYQYQTSDRNNLISDLQNKLNMNSNINLILNSQVTKIDSFEDSYELNLIHNNKKIKIMTKFLILGGGCFENSRLLLYSKINSSKNFLKDHNYIGKNFYDHVQLETGEFTADYKNFLDIFDKKYKNFEHELFFIRNKKLINSNKVLNHQLTLTFKTHPDQIKNFIRKTLCVSSKFNDKISKDLNDKLCLRGLLLSITPGPENNSQILLSNKKFDSNGINQINLNYSWRNDNSLRDTYEVVTKEFLTDLVKYDLGRGYFFDYEKTVSNKNLSGSTFHPSGGTSIGSTINDGCVDKNLQVFNHKNFFILGSSVFPRGNIVNPTFSIVMLSYRLADRLSQLL